MKKWFKSPYETMSFEAREKFNLDALSTTRAVIIGLTFLMFQQIGVLLAQIDSGIDHSSDPYILILGGFFVFMLFLREMVVKQLDKAYREQQKTSCFTENSTVH